ncbi:MAG: EF-P lysine aminoacylase GenX [Myxococcales bacterium]|nr:EF-P lysine aminoacylase GenX [Deltaproteobacteria bacterium]MBT8480661.1 EF-P lysine aminoacylase GenX [Deltaproteobacteria bacterium]NND30207.1 EF-P lysine aminoacylase GenX [Myxococcales bacterium]NNK44406.1 EF-P lysine aminoacylase GenX [Myxococcales bacterium]NNL23527.1 EF-P lysine aminoacylase GenX [Myxococcales bacterium]
MREPADAAVLQVLELRATLLAAIRRFFIGRDFIEVETPAIVPSPGLDLHLSAFEVRSTAGEPVGWLATSPEYQMKRLLSAGAKRIFQLCRSYRGEERGRHHEREFTMLEWYRANATSEEVIGDTEELVAFVTSALHQPAPEVQPPWQRITVDEALQLHAHLTLDSLSDDDERFFRVWAEEVQPRLGDERPVIVTDWPASMASLAQLKGNGMADRFEAFFRGVELCNGFGELTDATEQRRRFERDQAERDAAGVPVYPIDERFMEDLERGMPPSGGNALGVDRLLMLLIGAPSIQAVMPFPEKRL